MRGITLFAALVVALSGCGKDKGDEDPGLTFTTYNAGLAVAFVPSANERAPEVADAVAALESDFVCLQEVWLPEHVAMFEAAAKGTFDHTYFPAAQQEDMATAACDVGEIDGLVECMDTECGDVCDDELVDCLFLRCPLDFLSLGNTCNRCVQAHVGSTSDASVVADTCNNGGIEYAYGGSFGTGILSKYPMSVEEIVLDSTTNRRGLLHATVEGPDGTIDAWCTHLTAGLSLIPYPRDEGSWESEQLAQAELLGQLLTDAPDPVVALGDLNNGPTTSDAEAEFEANYNAILASGVTAPYVDTDGRCTFCPDNALSSVDSDETGKLIDHVLVRGFEGKPTANRELDGTLKTQTCGQAIDANYSDHYGVSVTFPL